MQPLAIIDFFDEIGKLVLNIGQSAVQYSHIPIFSIDIEIILCIGKLRGFGNSRLTSQIKGVCHGEKRL
jgi:hypothetical protein